MKFCLLILHMHPKEVCLRFCIYALVIILCDLENKSYKISKKF